MSKYLEFTTESKELGLVLLESMSSIDRLHNISLLSQTVSDIYFFVTDYSNFSCYLNQN